MKILSVIFFFVALFLIFIVGGIMYFFFISVEKSKTFKFAMNYIKSDDAIIYRLGNIKDIRKINKYALITRIGAIDEEGLFAMRVIGEKQDVNVKIQIVYDKQGVGKITECRIVSNEELENMHKEFMLDDW